MPIGVRRAVGEVRGAARGRAGLREPELSSVAALFRTLCDPTRLRLLSLLAADERCVHELCSATGMSQPAVSHQLRLLRAARLVRGRREGREVRYALDDEHVMELVAQARSHVGHLASAPRRRASSSGSTAAAPPGARPRRAEGGGTEPIAKPQTRARAKA